MIPVRVREATHFPLENGRLSNLLSPCLFEALRCSIKIIDNETKKTKALESGEGKTPEVYKRGKGQLRTS